MNMIEETVAHYDDNDRAIMTMAFLRFLRMLMSEVAVAFEKGARAAQARQNEEVLVHVEEETRDRGRPGGEGGDASSFMQRTLSGFMKKDASTASVNPWNQALQDLQVDLQHVEPSTRRANIEGLRSRLERDTVIIQAHRDQLQAVLVAMTDEDDGPPGVSDVGWQLQ